MPIRRIGDIVVDKVDLKFIIRSHAYEACRKRFPVITDRELFMAGVDYAIKSYQHLTKQQSNEKVDKRRRESTAKSST